MNNSLNTFIDVCHVTTESKPLKQQIDKEKILQKLRDLVSAKGPNGAYIVRKQHRLAVIEAELFISRMS